MAKKKKSWFSLVKRLFIWDTESKQEKKEKRRKWIFGRLKMKKMPSITAPPPSKEAKTTVIGGDEEEQSKHALTMAIASAEAAVAAAAQAAAEVARIAGIPESSNQCEEKYEESESVIARNDEACEYAYQCLREARESAAAIKIQTAFRGLLARKALRALKGIVKLQAIIRGRAVRRQAVSTLKCLQSIVSIQSQACARRIQMTEGRLDFDEKEEIQNSRDKIIRMDSNSERRWDDSILLKEETDASYISKREALSKREKIKESSFNHRRSAEAERKKVTGRWRYWLEQWVDTQLTKSKELEDLDSLFSSNPRAGEEYGGRQTKLRTISRQNLNDGLNSLNFTPRKHFPHRRQSSLGEEHSLPSSPVMPTYMAATESARAKARSTTSSPKLRSANLDISNSGGNSPCKKKISLVSTVNSECYSSVRMSKFSNNQQRSPSLKGISVPVKSNRMFKDLSVNSDSSLPSWDRQSSFK